MRPVTILARAVERLAVPVEFLSTEERAARESQSVQLRSAWEHLDPAARETLLRVAEGMRR